MSSFDRLETLCPECGCKLVLDRETGRVLLHESAPKAASGSKDFDQLLAGLDEAKSRAGQLFEKEMNAQKNRDTILAAKFEAALQRAKEAPDDEPRIRPFDLD